MLTPRAIARSSRLDWLPARFVWRMSRLDWLPLLGSLLIVLSLVAGLPSPVRAASFPGQIGVPQPPVDQATFERYLQAIGRPVVSRYQGYPASFATFRQKHLLVYGTPQTVPNNRFDSRTGEYQHLGYSYDETPVTNSDFPDTSSTGETYSTPWQWQELHLGLLAEISWARLTPRQQELIRQSPLYYRRRSYGGMTFGQLGLNAGTTQVLAQPSWQLGFALYTRHYLPGSSQIRYATLTGPGAGDVFLYGDIVWESDLTDNGQLYFEADEETITLTYQVTGGVASFTGLASASDLAYSGIATDDGEISGPGAGPWTITLTREIDRDFLADEPSRDLTLQATVWAVSHMGDIRLIHFSRTLTINAEQEEPFGADLSIEGGLNYFRNRQSGDQILARDEHRYLGLEQLSLRAEFSDPPDRAEFTGFGQTIDLGADGEATSFDWTMVVPLELQTLTWQNQRLLDPVVLEVTGEKETPTGPVSASARIQPVEITGDIHDLHRILSG